jgi:hypothetical protein
VALVTSALSAEGGSCSVMFAFSSAATDTVSVSASLDDTSMVDMAAVLASLLTDVTLGSSAQRGALDEALRAAAADYDDAQAEKAAEQRAATLRKQLEEAEAAAEAARARRRSMPAHAEEAAAELVHAALAQPLQQLERAAAAAEGDGGEEEDEDEEEDEEAEEAVEAEEAEETTQSKKRKSRKARKAAAKVAAAKEARMEA